ERGAGHAGDAIAGEAVEGLAAADLGAGGGGDRGGAARDLVYGVQLDRAGGGEVAEAGRGRALAHVDRRDGLGNDPVGVDVAVAVAVAGEVDGHAVDEDGDVGAVIGVDAAQEPLLGGAAAAVVLREQEAGHLA